MDKMVYVALKDEKIESVIGEVENREGAVLNSLEIDLWLSEQEAKGHYIEYLTREKFSEYVHLLSGRVGE